MTVTQLRPRNQTVASEADIAVDTSRQMIDANAFRHAMRNLAAGVSIVTSGKGPDRRGLTVTATCSLSAEPPSILVCVNRNAEAYSTIIDSRSFAVNFLAFDQLDIALRFAGRVSGSAPGRR
jgi:flavin reductase